MQNLTCNVVDRSRYVWEVWFRLQQGCGHFHGNDTGGRGLCSHDKNRSDVSQEHGCKRCGLPFCHYSGLLDKQVKRLIVKNNRDRHKNIIPIMFDTPLTQREPAKVIDITAFVSPDAIAYEHQSVTA